MASITNALTPPPVAASKQTVYEITSATRTEPTLRVVKACLQSEKNGKAFLNANHNALDSVEKLKTELTETSAGRLLRGTCIVILEPYEHQQYS